MDPGTAVASNVEESILYRAWLAGTLGSPDSATAEKYGPDLFRAQALTWREASILEADPEQGKQIIEEKKQAWEDVAGKIQDEDPEAYEYLTGQAVRDPRRLRGPLRGRRVPRPAVPAGVGAAAARVLPDRPARR